MLATVFTVLGGIVTVLSAAIPLFYKWKVLQDEKNKKIGIAPDSPERTAFIERMRQRKLNLSKARTDDEEKQP